MYVNGAGVWCPAPTILLGSSLASSIFNMTGDGCFKTAPRGKNPKEKQDAESPATFLLLVPLKTPNSHTKKAQTPIASEKFWQEAEDGEGQGWRERGTQEHRVPASRHGQS